MKSSQEDLADNIKALHANLRTQYINKEASIDEIWSKHLQNKPALQAYAKSMQELAQEYWKKHRETRIDWCYNYLISYFSADGHLNKFLSKDKRTLDYHNECLEKETDSQDIPQCCGVSFKCAADWKGHQQQIVQSLTYRHELNTIVLPIKSGIKLLDVGSCYAPFSHFEEFDCLSLDLCPANKIAYKCDFLDVQIGDCGNAPDISDDREDSSQKIVKSIPTNYFHGIVFSLLLEYMPSPRQRWSCCVNAHKVLQLNGVLLVVTPDSNKQHRGTQQMKDWKHSIESLGFQRCFYTKKDHIHCMAFRKIMDCDYSKTDNSKLLYIPQDFNTKASTSDSDGGPQCKRRKTALSD